MQAIPQTMHAIICSSFGAPEVMQWTERPVPQPADNEVLIKVAAAGVNRADTMQRQGKYPPPPGASDIMGMEVSGEILALGTKASRWKIGDKVCALLAAGGYAEYAVAPEGQCLPVPSNISMTEAAVLPEALITVWANLFESGALKPGETALVHGGSSGIGTTAIQMVKLFGAKIFVTVGTNEKAEACKKLGADLVINYKTEDFVTVIERATNKRGVDVVLDMVGGDYIARNLLALAPLGRHVSIATQQGKPSTIDMRLVMQKRLTITGSTLRSRSGGEKARLVHEIEKQVWPWVVSDALKPLIHHAYPIKNVAEAHKMMESSAHIGKIALEVAV
jgi:NADPH:quinone reductase